MEGNLFADAPLFPIDQQDFLTVFAMQYASKRASPQQKMYVKVLAPRSTQGAETLSVLLSSHLLQRNERQ